MKKAFISGTISAKYIEELRLKLSFIDYEAEYTTSITTEEKKERIHKMLEADIFVMASNPTGANANTFQFEYDLAERIGLPCSLEIDINALIAKKVVDDLLNNEGKSEEGGNEDV